MDSWATENLVEQNIENLKPYERNSRIHSVGQIMQIEKSITEFGWTTPILVDEENTIIAGHARYRAAKNLGIKKVPTLLAKGWTDQQKQAFVIADNRISENSSWDMGLLHAELRELAESGFDIDLTGFDDSMLSNFTPNIPDIDFSEVSQSDILKAQERQNDLTNTNVHVKEVICPHCDMKFEISGNG